ncbi:TetR/AcrR family transcriptional regulator [Umezawaea endophytica]|uniref:TetR/AcrR family transcriptional regulator n=1 Tax=Umezawaea endophytica TaxID=1654476 RepID=UPI0023DFCB20|nr:TetR/AcrR family transcriptional regulator [Umezawaea endophytica]
MRAKSSSGELTVTEQARRAQIVGAAIRTVAELDYASTSFKRIAERAGLSSTGLISYHFAGKQELVDEVFREVLAVFGRFVLERMNLGGSAAGELRAFLLANVEFMRLHPDHLPALVRLREHVTVGDGADSDHVALAALLREGQRLGEFREFDVDVMALFIMALRNGIVVRAAVVDLEVCGAELVEVVERATKEG